MTGHEDWRQVSSLTETSLAQVSDRFLPVDFLQRFIHFNVFKLSEGCRNGGMRVSGRSPVRFSCFSFAICTSVAMDVSAVLLEDLLMAQPVF